LAEKFLSSAAPVLGDAKARAVMGEVQSLANRESIEPLISALQLP
jgi:hypothetical protein